MAIPNSGVLREARSRRLACVAGDARSLDPGVQVTDEGASVNLFWHLLERRRRVPPWVSGEPESAAPPPDEDTTDREVPLWKRLTYLLQLRTDLLLEAGGPVEWPGPLFEYQVDGIQALLSRNAMLLADDMGLGKTIQTIAALRVLALKRELDGALVVVPAGLIFQWRDALRHWAPELRISTIRGPAVERAWQWTTPAHVYLTSYETLREDCTDNVHSAPRRRRWDVVILDEAQRIKNRDADVSHKCKLLRRRRAWALTGTPLENDLDDLASILEFVTPFDDTGRPKTLFAGPELAERHRTLQLRRRKVDVLPQLPPKLASQIALQLVGPQRESYERAERDGIFRLRKLGTAVRIENVLELITRLKQICNVCPATGQSAKIEDLSQRIATLVAEGHRGLIFSQFTDATHGARAIARQLETHRPLLFTGDLSQTQREEVIERFKRDESHKVLVLSLRAGGQGLNLQDASYVFHFDRWWNPAVERQAEDRSHRLGQTLPVHVYGYTCVDTIEERIDQILKTKQTLFDSLIDGVTIDLASTLTGDELFGLFGLARPTRLSS